MPQIKKRFWKLPIIDHKDPCRLNVY